MELTKQQQYFVNEIIVAKKELDHLVSRKNQLIIEYRKDLQHTYDDSKQRWLQGVLQDNIKTLTAQIRKKEKRIKNLSEKLDAQKK